ncbi:hypothetical protein AB1K56_02395 [Microbacterium sp. BWR-S6Y]|uniref:hypothetical protein n=1 Tax=Microbacterium sp. BWR-S6Y TaxID=3232073 RepID=UPI00352890FC
MTPPSPTLRRPADVLGIIATCVAGVLIVPTLGVYLLGLIPEMNAIWWLGIILLPLLFLDGIVVVLLAIVGLVVAARRAGRRAWSVTALVLGILMLVPALLILVP